MARSGVIAAMLVTLVAAAVVAEASERSGSGIAHCMGECYFDCTQTKIFTDGECKKDCVFACAKYGNAKKFRDQDDDTKFFPSWI
ncbi:hypothetical protein SASPL_137005 [Salvia splendens]|uniref:Uncharacterized protein n=1 Tax=Salvia splendens TaxID=180675 RepID=A0A8X8WSJ8_SALSN|nr:hypothetical protein SASPL_137005 [Salvia splendens]